MTGWRPDRLAERRPVAHLPDRARAGAAHRDREPDAVRQASAGRDVLRGGAAHQGGARARGGIAPARDRVARELNLLHVGDNRAIDLSGGQKKLLELGRALMAEPKLIMLDEPAAGINPTLAKKLGEHILALKARGITFLIIEHNMGLVAALCDHVVVLVQGKRFTEGRFADLRADPRVQEAYMGHRA